MDAVYRDLRLSTECRIDHLLTEILNGLRSRCDEQDWLSG
jgi:hypothetical protein